MNRRDLIAGTAGLSGLGALSAMLGLPEGLLTSAAVAQGANAGNPFDAFSVRQMARELAGKPYVAPETNLPPQLNDLSYDDYRRIRFVPDQSIWRGQSLPFEMQMLSRGFLYRERVAISIVREGRSQPVAFTPQMFRYYDNLPAPDPALDLGFSGFRLHTALNRPDYFDEAAVFQGASYFRALARNQVYGVSARGLSIRTGDPGGEEFPFFKAFWIEQPLPSADSIVVHALLDSRSAAAAYRFTIRPGDPTTFAVEMVLYPRTDMDHVGIGTLTSMFLFGPNDRMGFDDYRPAVRDSNGLSIINGRGERLWRPLANPTNLQTSSFVDNNPRGFGLLQRERAFFDYRDLEARYEKRPSVWIEPIGDWGEGAIVLLEIPTQEEIHDNIAVFWRPRGVLRAKGEYGFTYRMMWGWDQPERQILARFADTRVGAVPNGQRFVVDIVGDRVRDVDLSTLRADVASNVGKIHHVVLQANPEVQGLRLSFIMEPAGADLVEIRASVQQGDVPLSEIWLYRWTP